MSDGATGKPLTVVPYDPGWASEYEGERRRLAALLGSAAVAIHHIGSTSVPGLAAKPVIDVLVEASELEAVDRMTPILEANGLEARGEHGIPGRRYFVGRTGGGLRLHVHTFRREGEEARRHLLFRDYLREHPDAASEYAQLKVELSHRLADDREAYQHAKGMLVEKLQALALRWGGKRDASPACPA